MANPGYPQQKFEPPPAYPDANAPGQDFVGFHPPPPPHTTTTTTVITGQPLIARTVVTGYAVPATHFPCRLECPHCHADVSTNVQYETGNMAHVAALVLCLFGCWLGCCLIPYCVDGCKDTVHTCPSCGRHLGVVKRL